MTDIVFVVPAFKEDLKDESIGTLILAKKAKETGFSVVIFRFWEVMNANHDYDDFRNRAISRILSHSPSIVSFYCRCTDYHICLDLSAGIKALAQTVRIVFGGPQAELVAKETIVYFPYIDYVCCSEGENTIIPFLSLLLRNSKKEILPSDVPGLTFKNDNGEVIQNPFPVLLPTDYCSEVDYYDLIPESLLRNANCINIDVGRGCPFRCTFCSTKTFWKQKFRLRNIQDLIKEIERVYYGYGIRKFDFDHDLFTVNSQKVVEFCQELMKRDLKIRWYCSSRIDTIHFDLIDLMARAGCYKILYGIETGSPRMQKLIRKNLDLHRCEEVIKYTMSKGMKVVASFIYGFPDETESDFESSFELMQRLASFGVKVLTWRCGIMNGTELFEKNKEKLFVNPDNIKNSSYFGYDELYSLICTHLDVFPHFCDFPSPLRKELYYFELFRAIWNYYDPKTYDRLKEMFSGYKYPLLEMYRFFVRVNLLQLESVKLGTGSRLLGLSQEYCQSLTDRFRIALAER